MKYKLLGPLLFLYLFCFSFNSLSDDSLKFAVNNKLRGSENISRDKYRNPYDTLSFFEISRNKKVLEVIPGTGWYTEIISKYMRGTQNFYVLMYGQPQLDILKKIQKKFSEKFDNNESFGDIQKLYFNPTIRCTDRSHTISANWMLTTTNTTVSKGV